MISDCLPESIRVVVVSATGLLRSEIAACFDEDFEVIAVADARSAEEAAATGPHALIVVTDDVVNCHPEELVQRVRIACRATHRVAAMFLSSHAGELDLSAAYHAGADDIARWPMEADMFRARVRSMVRVAALEASMGQMAESGEATVADLQAAVAQAIHLINNSVAGISGRAQLAALGRSGDESGLIPVCLSEARKMSLVLAALHALSESIEEARERDESSLLTGAGR